MRTGQLYRSVEPDHLQGQDEDLESFRELGIRTVFDLRTAAEREAALVENAFSGANTESANGQPVGRSSRR